MKITCTKKLIIIILTLLCAIAVGLGVMFAANSSGHRTLLQESVAEDISDEPSTNEADESEDGEGEALADFDPAFDEGELKILSERLGLDYAAVNFYAHAMNKSAADIDAMLNIPFTEEELAELEEGETPPTNEQIGAEQISTILHSYSEGELDLAAGSESEDWYISPDDVSSYAYVLEYLMPSQNYKTNNYSFKKNGVTITATTEAQLWGSSKYVLGDYYNFIGGMKTVPAGRMFDYFFVWLEPGETFQIGVLSQRNCSTVSAVAEDAPTFFKTYLTQYNPDNSFSYPGYGTYTGWFTYSPVNPATGQREQAAWLDTPSPNSSDLSDWIGKDPNGKSLKEYCEEYSSNITPSTAFMGATSYNTATWNYINLSGDAPSGVYSLRWYNPRQSGDCKYFGTHGTASTNNYNVLHGTYNPKGMWEYTTQNSRYVDVKVIVLRNSVEQPIMKFDDGVDSAREKREVTYNGDFQQVTFENDYGPGLVTTQLFQRPLEQQYTSTNVWYTYGRDPYKTTDTANYWFEVDLITNTQPNTPNTVYYKWDAATSGWLEYDAATAAWIPRVTQPQGMATAPPLPYTGTAMNISHRRAEKERLGAYQVVHKRRDPVGIRTFDRGAVRPDG